MTSSNKNLPYTSSNFFAIQSLNNKEMKQSYSNSNSYSESIEKSISDSKSRSKSSENNIKNTPEGKFICGLIDEAVNRRLYFDKNYPNYFDLQLLELNY